jgi:TonB family protein
MEGCWRLMARPEGMLKVRHLCIALCLLGINVGGAFALGQDGPDKPPVSDIVPGRLIKRVDPVYPEIAKVGQLDGRVVMNIMIGADGTVKDIKVTRGLPQLIGSAVHAVSQWVYEPARVDGVATSVATTVMVDFKLEHYTGDTNVSSQQGGASAAVAMAAKTPLPPPPAGVTRISGRVMANMMVKKVDPIYPADSIALGAQGTVVLLAIVTKTGEVGDVQVVSGPERFRSAAVDAVKQWRYSPYPLDGVPADVQTTISLSFSPPH